MRRLVLAALVLLIAVPAASAKSFHADTLSGDLSFHADPAGEALLRVGWVGASAKIVGPRALTGIACIDGAALRECVQIRRTKRLAIWTVIEPVKLEIMQEGSVTISLRKASGARDVFISGCGLVRLLGTGMYSADDAEPVSYSPADSAVLVDLRP